MSKRNALITTSLISVMSIVGIASYALYGGHPPRVSNMQSIAFNTELAVECEEGQIVWDGDAGTLKVGMPGGEVCWQAGQELFLPRRVKNASGADMSNGDIIYISGGTGVNISVSLADASNDDASTRTIAILTEDVDDNEFGYATISGLVRGSDTQPVDTSSYSPGTPLYLSATTPGGFTDTVPTSPNNNIRIGHVFRQHATEGWIIVGIQTGRNVGELNDVLIDSISDGELLAWDNGDSRWENKVTTVDIPFCISMFDPTPSRASVSDWNGGLLMLSEADTLSNGDNITVTKGTGEVFLVVQASNDAVGDITITGDTIDRDTGAVSAADTDTITLDGNSTDTSTTDTNGNPVYTFVDSYISSKWFTGSVILSTTEVDLTDVDVYHVSFEQLNDNTNLTVNSYDINLYTTNVLAEFDTYLYTLRKDTGSKCHVDKEVDMHIGADGQTAIANKYWRLRYGVINEALDGSTDGFWCEMHYSNTPAYVEDVTGKVWFTKTQSLTLN